MASKLVKEIIPVMSLTTTLIFAYGKYRKLHPEFKDPLMLKLGIWDLDGWSVTHFLFYSFLGYKYPDYSRSILGLSILWEGFEHFMGKERPAILGGFADCPDNVNIQNNGEWWYGRLSDIIVNTIGFYLTKNAVTYITV